MPVLFYNPDSHPTLSGPMDTIMTVNRLLKGTLPAFLLHPIRPLRHQLHLPPVLRRHLLKWRIPPCRL